MDYSGYPGGNRPNVGVGIGSTAAHTNMPSGELDTDEGCFTACKRIISWGAKRVVSVFVTAPIFLVIRKARQFWINCHELLLIGGIDTTKVAPRRYLVARKLTKGLFELAPYFAALIVIATFAGGIKTSMEGSKARLAGEEAYNMLNESTIWTGFLLFIFKQSHSYIFRVLGRRWKRGSSENRGYYSEVFLSSYYLVLSGLAFLIAALISQKRDHWELEGFFWSATALQALELCEFTLEYDIDTPSSASRWP